MLRPRRFEREIDPGPVQIQARKVHFDLSGRPLQWIPGHPVASSVFNLLNVVFPASERWFVATFNEALPLVKDARLADDMRGFIGQESTHADTHERALHEYLVANGVDPKPILDQLEYLFEKVLAPTTSTDPKRRFSNLCDRLWLIAALEHYTAVLGDFALNSTWDDYNADPVLVDLYRWHGSEEVEHRSVAHNVAAYFHDSYFARVRAMLLAIVVIAIMQRPGSYLMKADPQANLSWWQLQRQGYLDAKAGLLPQLGKLLGSNTFAYFRPGFTPAEIGSTAQAVAYLANSPAARAAHL